MKRLAAFAFVATLPVLGFAQSNYSFDDEVNAELDRLYSESGSGAQAKAQSSPQVQINVQASPSVNTNQAADAQTAAQASNQTSTESAVQTGGAQAAAPVTTAAQAQTAGTTAVDVTSQTQATTQSGATLVESIRKDRRAEESKTEQTIAEKLEQSRLEDERRRAEVLFGDRFSAMMNRNQEQKNQQEKAAVADANAQAATVAPLTATQGTTIIATDSATVQNGQTLAAAQETTPVVVAEPTVVVPAEKSETISKEELRGEVEAQLAELNAKTAKGQVEEQKVSQTYISGLAGLAEYPDASNVKGNYAVGFAVGTRIGDRSLFEGSFVFSSFDVEQSDGQQVCDFNGCTFYPRMTGMDQYQMSALGKYEVFKGTITPVVGGLVAYTYRSFKDIQLAIPNNDGSSHAIDLGLMAGLDFEVSKSFSIGLDARYLFNIYSRASNRGLQQSFVQSADQDPIEKFNQVTIGVVGRASF